MQWSSGEWERVKWPTEWREMTKVTPNGCSAIVIAHCPLMGLFTRSVRRCNGGGLEGKTVGRGRSSDALPTFPESTGLSEDAVTVGPNTGFFRVTQRGVLVFFALGKGVCLRLSHVPKRTRDKCLGWDGPVAPAGAQGDELRGAGGRHHHRRRGRGRAPRRWPGPSAWWLLPSLVIQPHPGK